MQRLYKLSESRFTGFKDFEDKILILGERGVDNPDASGAGQCWP